MKSLKLNIVLCSVLYVLSGYESSVFTAERMVAGSLRADQSPAGESRILDLIYQAGNAADDETRLEVLLVLSKLPDLDKQLKADTERLMDEIKRWLYDKSLTYFGRSIRKTND